MIGKSELAIFDKPSPQTIAESAVIVDIHPNSSISGTVNPYIEFVINGSQEEYLDLNDTILYVHMKAVTKENGELPPTAKATPNNYFLNALFDDITLSLNNVVIEGGNIYPYKATFDNIFNFTEDTKRIQLLPSGYDESAEDRKGWISKSREFELTGALRLDFFNQPKYLLPGVEVRIQLRRSKNEFAFVAEGVAPKVHIIKSILYVRRVKVNPAVSIGHELGLRTQNAIYPYTRTKVVSYGISKGSLSYYKDMIFGNSRLPKFVVVGFVRSDAYNGSFAQEAFNFQNFQISSLGLYRDGQALPYTSIYQPDFENNLYTREYVTSIIHNTEHLNRNTNNGITKNKFAHGGYTLFTFNLTPDWSIAQTQRAQDGNIRLDVKFATALPQPINIIVYGLFDSELQITKNRRIIADPVV